MYRAKRIFIKRRKSDAVGYFSDVCRNFKSMRNVANFYERNVFSGLSKNPKKRTHNETEVLHHVFTGIQRANVRSWERYESDLRKEAESGTAGMKLHVYARNRLDSLVLFDYPTRERSFLSYEVLDAIFKFSDNETYRSLPAQVNQNAIRKTVDSWKSFFKARKEYAENPSKFRGRPRIPGYLKTDESTAWFSNQTARLKDVGGRKVLSFPKSGVVVPVGNLGGKYVKTEVKPVSGGYLVLVVYDDGLKEIPVPKNPKVVFGIDLGLENFAAVTNNVGVSPFLVKGTVLKSRNHFFNKRRAELISAMTRGFDPKTSKKDSRALSALSRKRDAFFFDFFYKVAHYVCRIVSANGGEAIVVGLNPDWKNEISLGRTNNQAFVGIPFRKFLSALKSVAWKFGIAVVEREESYTSKASFLDMDEIPTYGVEKVEKPVFSGRRVRRGLYRSSNGILINADVNGSANVVRKEYPHAFDGLNLDYMYETTNVVGFKDLYEKGDPKVVAAKRAIRKTKSKKKGVGSRVRHEERKSRKFDLMMAFDAGKRSFVRTNEISIKEESEDLKVSA